jgi:uncharacterized protein YnzC (UPF0291/DUF896 family)
MEILQRNFNSKDEELPSIGSFLSTSLENDLPDFTAFSPSINAEYLSGFKTTVKTVAELIAPQSEMLKTKAATQRLYATMDEVNNWLTRLTGYIKLAKLPAADFDIAAARKRCAVRDVEGFLQRLKVVADSIETYREVLLEKGLTEEQIETFGKLREAIAENNREQYRATVARKAIVQENVQMLNGLYEQIMEICNIGKILYKGVNPVKLQEYTFAALRKKVRYNA